MKWCILNCICFKLSRMRKVFWLQSPGCEISVSPGRDLIVVDRSQSQPGPAYPLPGETGPSQCKGYLWGEIGEISGSDPDNTTTSVSQSPAQPDESCIAIDHWSAHQNRYHSLLLAQVSSIASSGRVSLRLENCICISGSGKANTNGLTWL